MELHQKQLAFLEDTCNFYNSTNRGFCEQRSGCVYQPLQDSPGCAIGRHLPKELAIQFDDTFGQSSGVANEEIFKALPEWLQELEQGFLCKIQRLHDNAHNWTSTGLSERGVQARNEIIETYKLV